MQIEALKQSFYVVCRAFPRSNVAILKENGEVLLSHEPLKETVEIMRLPLEDHAETIQKNGSSFRHVLVSLGRELWMSLLLPSEEYESAEAAEKMVRTLIALQDRGEENRERKRNGTVPANPLLTSLLYADTMEMQTYSVLLAEEQRIRLEIPRVVCVIPAAGRDMEKMLYHIRRFGETFSDDITGTAGGDNIVLCRCLKDPVKSIRYQCREYLEALVKRIEVKCGFTPQIWVGTKAKHIWEYRYSMEAAMVAGSCMSHGAEKSPIAYAADHLLEYVMVHTDPKILKHFLEPYIERLKPEPGLVDTAEVLLENNMNISAAAKQKFMHRNTMMIHASRLCDLLSIDPACYDRDRFLLMMICFYYRNYK